MKQHLPTLFALASLSLPTSACGQAGSPDRATPLDGGPSTSAAPRGRRSVEKVLSASPALAPHRGLGGRLLVTGQTARLDAPGGALRGEVALRGSKTTLRGGDDRALLTFEVVAPQGAREATSTATGARLEAREVAPGLDRVVVLERDRVEDLWVLHDAAAPTSFRYRLRRAATADRLVVRASRFGSTVALLDPIGRERLATLPIVAIDARGVQRAPTVTLDARDGETLSLALDPAGLAYPIVVDPAWTTTAHAMSRPRAGHGATRLADGRVLITGGVGGEDTADVGAEDSAELYDPTTDAFAPPMQMVVPKLYHRAIALPSGKVLVLGGRSRAGTDDAAAALFDPTAGTWSKTGGLSGAREGLAAELLADGSVLAVGGSDSGVVSPFAERYDESTGAFTTDTHATLKLRSAFATARLADGSVLVCGGYTSGMVERSCEALPSWGSGWTTRASMRSPRKYFTMAALADGRVLALGGQDANASSYFLSSAEIYDPVADAWTIVAPMASARGEPQLAQLATGDVVVALGSDDVGTHFSTTEVFDPKTLTFSAGRDLTVGRESLSRLTRLDGSGLLVTGGYFASSAERFQARPNGDPCSAHLDCNSGRCVDGVCCATACPGACMACDLPTSVGTCSAVSGAAPHGARTCTPYALCDAGACLAGCKADSDCLPTSYCGGGACLPRRANGSSCAAGHECTTGSCVDGYCCDGGCGGNCEACDVAGHLGACRPVLGAPHGARPACGGVGAGTECGQTCNGVARASCTFPPIDVTVCGKVDCAAGIETHVSSCDGAGRCRDVPNSCGVYACDATTCKTRCDASSDCAAGSYCKANVCVPIEGLGTACSDASSCASGHCVEGVCCASAACPAEQSCALAGHEGLCAKGVGLSCSVAADCATGHCVDGVCCDTACGGQCEACGLAGHVGRCTPVQGRPVGARAACPTAGGSPCAQRLCDGSTVGSCAGFVASDVPCRDAACSDGIAFEAAGCAGDGACPPLKKSLCGGYLCDAAGVACLATCADDEACAEGYSCVESKCAPKATRCSEDGTAVIDAAGQTQSCAPLLCKGGACPSICLTTSDCVPGTTCETSTGRCVSIAGSSSGGGCAQATGAPGIYATLLAMAALGLGRRRLRARAPRG